MGRYAFKVPDVGEGVAEAEIAQWRVTVGDNIKEDQPLVDLLTEKAAVEIPSPVSGKVLALRGVAGDKVAVGSEIAVIEITSESSDEAHGLSRTSVEPTEIHSAQGAKPRDIPANAAASDPVNPHPAASPAVRKRARELGIALTNVLGTGPSGRITHADLEKHQAAQRDSPITTPASPTTDAITEIKVIGIRRKIAEAMQRSKQRIPHFAYVEEVDVTELELLRAHLNNQRKPDQAKLSLLPFLIRALVKTLPSFPNINARFDDEANILRQYRALHAGIAAQTPTGLLVPVIRHAETLDVWGAAARIKQLAEAARAGKCTRDELSDSTITVTSLGRLGGIASTPIINAPEVAIVGVNKVVQRPVVVGGAIQIRESMNLSSSFDHRIIDGWEAANFIQAIKQLLEYPATLFMP